jgi:hypothetical protein
MIPFHGNNQYITIWPYDRHSMDEISDVNYDNLVDDDFELGLLFTDLLDKINQGEFNLNDIGNNT